MNRLLTTVAAFALTASVAAAQTTGASSATKTPAGKAAAASTASGGASSAAPSPAATATTAAPSGAASATGGAKVVANGDIIQTAKASGQFNTFLKAADATNLTPVLKNNKNLTVFLPTDAAFASLPAGELDKLMADKAALQKVITYHIINAPVDSSKIKGAKGPVPTVAGSPVELDGSGDQLMVNNADIVQADIRASNGVIHVVDKVLTPGGATAAAATGASTSASAQAPATAASTSTSTTTGDSTSASKPGQTPAKGK